MLGSDLLARAIIILQDDDNVRWPLPELVKWLNDGQRAVVTAKPSANSASVAMELDEGTLQTLAAAEHLLLLRIPRNLKTADPRVGGRAIRPVSREVLDASSPGWHDRNDTRFRAEVRQYVYDEETPREFYVYPGNDGTGIIEAVVAVLPDDLEATGDVDEIASYATELSLPEPYPIIVLDYVLYRAFAKDDTGADVSRARLHYMAFAQALGIKIQSEAQNSPNTKPRIASA